MYRPNLKSVALPVPDIIAIEVLGGGCEPQSWGKGGRMLSGMVPFERALVSSYMPSKGLHSNFSSIFTRFRDIAAFVLQHATFSNPIPLVSPKFPHVNLWATKSEGVGLIVCAISFQDFQPMWS